MAKTVTLSLESGIEMTYSIEPVNLIKKYNIPGPRYTSYPTVPYWDIQNFSISAWQKKLSDSLQQMPENAEISLYIHLPFCESLCTFCACNKHITRNHDVEQIYIEYLLKEWRQLRSQMVSPPVIRELHLGGGTPTFFSPQNISYLVERIMESVVKPDQHEYSVEGHPNNTTPAHLKSLFKLGFDRISFGVQDYSATVQQAINRIQPFERVQKVTQLARETGFASVTHDLVFGLPFQTQSSIRDTIDKTLALKPERIAFYSYAHVPWIKGSGQRAYDKSDLPDEHDKRRLYEIGRQRFLQAGYIEIGMDHFALPQDRLYQAYKEHRLHRNFMGYTENRTDNLIGLGVSAISDYWQAFTQNVKTVKEYYAKLDNGDSPILRGHLLSDEDLVIRQHILNLMCRFKTCWQAQDKHCRKEIVQNLQEFEKDGLIGLSPFGVDVTETGKMFIRNICMAFDLKLLNDKSDFRLFSMTI